MLQLFLACRGVAQLFHGKRFAGKTDAGKTDGGKTDRGVMAIGRRAGLG